MKSKYKKLYSSLVSLIIAFTLGGFFISQAPRANITNEVNVVRAAKRHRRSRRRTTRRRRSTKSRRRHHGKTSSSRRGKIVGNRKSKIYHTPGQEGYRMSSANAVYFNSERAARRAGYRKSER